MNLERHALAESKEMLKEKFELGLILEMSKCLKNQIARVPHSQSWSHLKDNSHVEVLCITQRNETVPVYIVSL